MPNLFVKITVLAYYLKYFYTFVITKYGVMAKNYFYIALLLGLFSFAAQAQEGKQTGSDALGFFPNPVSNGKIYITSKTSLDKNILIFDVLGKKVFEITISSKELNIASIPPGVYIIKITEGDTTATRKLIVR
jgi:fumarate reductase subunit C